MKQYSRIVIACTGHFLAPFLREALGKYVAEADRLLDAEDSGTDSGSMLVIADPDLPAGEAEDLLDLNSKSGKVVLLSRTRVYNIMCGENIGENTPVLAGSPEYIRELRVGEMCARQGRHLTVLRLPDLVIGTGMDGMPMRMVTQINRGTYLHIKDDETRRSTIHASSIGDAAALAPEGVFNLCDPDAPTVRELAEALSTRLGYKKIFSASLPMARRMARVAPLLGIGGWSREMLDFKTMPLTFSAEKAREAFGFNPTPAVTYLTTHVYDENSL